MIRRALASCFLLLVLVCPAAAELSPLVGYAGTWVVDAPGSLALVDREGGDQSVLLQRLSERLRLRVEGDRLVFVRGRREDVLHVDLAVPEEGGLRLTGRTETGVPLVLHLQELAGGGMRLLSDSSEVLDGCLWQRLTH
jgi:hypothetical protein